jgi:hypothetical protein
VLPSIAGLAALATLLRLRRVELRRAMREVAAGAAVFLALTLVLVGPALRDLLLQRALKGDRGQLEAATFRHSLLLLHGTTFDLPLLAWALLAAAGLWMLARRWPHESLVLAGGLAVQVGALGAVGPIQVELPFVFLRYLSPWIPFLLLLVVLPVASLLDALVRSTRIAVPLAIGLVVALGAFYLARGWYSIGSAYNAHPSQIFITRALLRDPAVPLSPFYEKLAEDPLPGGIVEAPLVLSFPPYGLYQGIHGRDVRVAILGHRFSEQTLLDPRFRGLASTIPLDRESLGRSGARLLVFHKEIGQELLGLLEAARRTWPASTQLPASDRMIEAFAFVDHGGEPIAPPAWIGEAHEVVYEDRWIVVYDLGQQRSRGTGIKPWQQSASTIASAAAR